MTRRQREEYRLDTFAEREHLRDIAQTVPCPDPGCEQPIGSPCINRVGEPLRRMDHPNRLRNAQRAREHQ